MDQQFFNYPIFVPNQVLTPDGLNSGFDYLEEQERMTRLFLTGTGIICGLQVSVASDGTSLTIGCGYGVTTEGYLIKVDQTTYNLYAAFDFTSTNVYPPFCKPAGSMPPPPPYEAFTIYELYNNTGSNDPTNPPVPAPNGVTTQALNTSFLNGMVVVLLYDLNDVQALNCDSESCDGLGINVQITIRALLINASSVPLITGATGNGVLVPGLFYNTIDLNVNRFNVPSYNICTTGDFYMAYQQSFISPLITDMQCAFAQMYGLIQPLVAAQYPTDPLAGFTTRYGTLTNAADFAAGFASIIFANQMVQIQYVYDHFINLIEAYNDLCGACLELNGNCCPPDTFPRHLLLGLLTQDSTTTPPTIDWSPTSIYYTGFMPSGAITGYSGVVNQVVALYDRLVLMYQNFNLPGVLNLPLYAPGMGKIDENIKITPTISGPEPLREKSIPFYYNQNFSSMPVPLLDSWNYELNLMNKSQQNLSYWANTYSQNPLVYDPLVYDLERYNFFRVEGILGKPYSTVVSTLETLISRYRLPFDVVVVATGSCACEGNNAAPAPPGVPLPLLDSIPTGLFNDLELAYNTAISEIKCRFIFFAQSLFLIPSFPRTPDGSAPLWTGFPIPKTSQIPLLQGITLPPNTYGSWYEKNLPYNSAAHYMNPIGTVTFWQEEFDFIFAGLGGRGIWVALGAMSCNCVYIMQYIYTLLHNDLPYFASQVTAFDTYYNDLTTLCDFLLEEAGFDDYVPSPTDDTTAPAVLADLQVEDIKILLNDLRSMCKGGVLDEIVTEYNARLNQFSSSLTFNCFSQDYPGLQHRAGVPMGGTLVLVAHYASTSDPGQTDRARFINAILSYTNLPGPPSVPNPFYIPSGTIIADFFIEKCAACNVPATTLSIGLDAQRPFINISPTSYVVTTDSYGNVISQGNTGVLTFGPLHSVSISTLTLAQIGVMAPAVAAATAGAVIGAGGTAVMATAAGTAAANGVFSGLTPDAIGAAAGAAAQSAGASTPVIAVASAAATASVSASLSADTGGAAVLMIDGQMAPIGGDFSPKDYSTDFGPQNPNFNSTRYAPQNGALSRSVIMAYTVNGVTASTTAYVYLQPVASFTPSAVAGADTTSSTTVLFDCSSSKNYTSLSISFGDGQSTTLPSGVTSVTHTYPPTGTGGQGSYWVTLTASNGPIPAVSSSPVNPASLNT